MLQKRQNMSEYSLYFNVLDETIARIENSIKSITKEQFLADITLQDATLMRLQVIGENINNLPRKMKKESGLKWRKFEKLRNLISHRYASVDYLIVWDFINNRIVELKEGLVKLKQLDNRNV